MFTLYTEKTRNWTQEPLRTKLVIIYSNYICAYLRIFLQIRLKIEIINVVSPDTFRFFLRYNKLPKNVGKI